MRLSLSTRVAEAPKQKETALMGLDGLIDIAKSSGYSALCMRASQVGVQTPADTRREAAARVRKAGLAVSMITGNIDIPANNERAGMALRNIAPFLDVAQSFSTDLIRIGMKAHTDVAWARRACDEAAERGIRLAHQCHTCTLFETIDLSSTLVASISRGSSMVSALRGTTVMSPSTTTSPTDWTSARASAASPTTSAPWEISRPDPASAETPQPR